MVKVKSNLSDGFVRKYDHMNAQIVTKNTHPQKIPMNIGLFLTVVISIKSSVCVEFEIMLTTSNIAKIESWMLKTVMLS